MVFQFFQGFGSGHEHGGAFGWQIQGRVSASDFEAWI
jgi:hypothetical protein